MTAWRRHRIEAAALELDVLDGPELVEEPGQLFQAAAPLVLGVLWGADATLDSWRARFAAWPPAAFGAETTAGGARRLEVAVEAAFADAILEGGTHELVGEPPRTVVAVALERRPVPALAHWSVATELRDAYRDDERHFFAALSPD